MNMSFSLLTIFGAGLLTFASPCVLPLMPIYLATIVGDALDKARPWRALLTASSFTSGFTLVFIALGALASSVGKLLLDYQRPITLVSGLLMIAFGLRGLGLFRVALFDRDARPAMQRMGAVSGAGGAFMFGAAFALGWSPCIGPVLASVLTYTAEHAESPWRGAGYLAVYAAGIALPMLLLAAAAPRAVQLVRSMRVALPWLERLTAAALLGVGIWTLGPLLSEPQPSAAVADQSAPQASCEQVGPGHTCAITPIDTVEAAELEPDGVAQQRQQLLEFGAHDCPVCRRMRPVLDRLVTACAELDSWVVHVDVATQSGRALASRYGVRGTPTFLFLNDKGEEGERLLGETTEADIAAAVERTFGLSCSS